jgi:transposase-like protein
MGRPRKTQQRYDWTLAAALHDEGASDHRVAHVVGCSRQAVAQWRAREGRSAHRPGPIDEAAVARLERAGLPIAEIAGRLGQSEARLRRWLLARGA